MENKEKIERKEGEPFSLEQTFEQLEGVIERLQDNEISLEEAFREYEQGMKLL